MDQIIIRRFSSIQKRTKELQKSRRKITIIFDHKNGFIARIVEAVHLGNYRNTICFSFYLDLFNVFLAFFLFQSQKEMMLDAKRANWKKIYKDVIVQVDSFQVINTPNGPKHVYVISDK